MEQDVGSRGSLEPQLPCYVSCGNAGGNNTSQRLISLHSDFRITAAADARRRDVNLGSRLSRDGGAVEPMTDVDANIDRDQTLTQTSGSTSTLSVA